MALKTRPIGGCLGARHGDGLAPYMRELRLLEIGDDVGGAERNDGHGLRPGLYVLADAERAPTGTEIVV